jgi:hypothetical protein
MLKMTIKIGTLHLLGYDGDLPKSKIVILSKQKNGIKENATMNMDLKHYKGVSVKNDKPSLAEQKQNFDTVCNESYFWEKKANELVFSANILNSQRKETTDRHPVGMPTSIERIETIWIIHMLSAMAIECLLKGLWVHSGEILADNGVFKGIPDTNNHKLASLAKKVAGKIELNLSAEENTMLDRLSYLITFGRYPVQRKFDTAVNMPFPKGGSGSLGYMWVSPQDELLVESIINKLKNNFATE